MTKYFKPGKTSMNTYKPEAMQALVEASPAAVASHDKAAWLALFARHFSVEDPVGSLPVTDRRDGSIEQFYDTFIAPNDIRFEVSRDYYGNRCVLRDLTIHIDMAPAVSVSVPMHLLYTIDEENSSLKISRLAAHWELVPMVIQLLKQGLPALRVMTGLSGRMIRQLGIRGTLGFSKAALTPRRRLYRRLDELVTAINCQDLSAVQHCFATGSAGMLIDSTGHTLRLADLKGIRTGKRIAAGRWISASITLAGKPGVVIGETCPAQRKLLHCTLYR